MEVTEGSSLAPGLLWAQVAGLWMLANYASQDPSDHREAEEKKQTGEMKGWKWKLWGRAMIVAAGAGLLPGLDLLRMGPRVVLAGIVMAGLLVMAHGRISIVERRAPARSPFRDPVDLQARRGIWLAEWEIGMNVLVLGAVGTVIRTWGLTIDAAVVLPLTEGRLICLSAAAALVLFLGRGAAHTVRGFMNKVGTLPITAKPQAAGVDWAEYNRGRMIGILERMLLTVFMAVQAYQAIGLQIAAKGLIRSKELEDRGFAEYFLVGTLASTLLAIGAGVLIQLLFRTLW